MGKIWERLEGEGDAPYQAFEHYRLSGHGRNINETAKILNRKPQTFRRYSYVYNWKERVKAWDAECQRAADAAMLSEVQQLAVDQLKAWRGARLIGATAISRILKKAQKSKNPPATILEAVRLLEAATKYERLIVGDATERVESDDKWDLSQLTPEEIQTIRRLKAKAKSGDGLSD